MSKVATRLELAQRAPAATPEQKLERKLLHVINMERKAGTRVRRAATVLQKWQNARRRIERRIGEGEVRRIINRLTTTEGK